MRRVYKKPISRVINNDGMLLLLTASRIKANEASVNPTENMYHTEYSPDVTLDSENPLTSKGHNGEWEDLYETFGW